MVVYPVILSRSPRRYSSGSVEEPGYSLRPAPHRTARLPVHSPSPRLCTRMEAFTAASSLPLIPRSPTGSTTLTLSATLPPTSTSVSCTPATVNATQGQGTTCNAVVSNSNKFTVILIASSPGFPSVTAAVTITITNPSTAAATGSVSWTSSASGTFTPGSSCIVYIQCSVTYTPTLISPLVTTQEIEAHYNGDSSHSPSIGRVLLNVVK